MENGYVGVQSGIMDQFASVHGRQGHALLLDCRSLEHELIPTPDDLVFLVADTGVRRALAADTGFNDRKSECALAADLLRPSPARASPPFATWSLPTSTGCSTSSSRRSRAARATWSPSADASSTARTLSAAAICTGSAT